MAERERFNSVVTHKTDAFYALVPTLTLAPPPPAAELRARGAQAIVALTHTRAANDQRADAPLSMVAQWRCAPVFQILLASIRK
jgi:hypothetical protein